MIVVKLEMWPKGSEEGKYSLGEIRIANDVKTSRENIMLGSYEVKLMKSESHGATKPGVWRKGRVDNFPRKKLGAYDLLFRALQACLGNRNPEAETKFIEIEE